MLDVQYVGDSGVTQYCIDAVCGRLQYGEPVSRTRLLSANGAHAFALLSDLGPLTVVRSGFASGYGGEAPRGLSKVIRLLMAFGVEPVEMNIPPQMMKRLNESRLTKGDVSLLLRPEPAFGGSTLKYLLQDHIFIEPNELTVDVMRPVIPFGALDPRLVDLAVSFWQQPDDRLLRGYRRLEESVRNRAGLEADLPAATLFRSVFGSKGQLVWDGLSDPETSSRRELFAQAFSAFRNRRAHGEIEGSRTELLAEFMTLNHLYLLEREAVERTAESV